MERRLRTSIHVQPERDPPIATEMTTLTAASQLATTVAILAYLMWRSIGRRRHGARFQRRVRTATASVIFLGFNALIQEGSSRILLLVVMCILIADAVISTKLKR